MSQHLTYTEQWAIFGQGALRISARELLDKVNDIRAENRKEDRKIREKAPSAKIPFKSKM